VHFLLLICAFIPVLVYAFSYSIGGRDTAPLVRPRIWRRIIAPLALTIPLIISHKLYFTPAIISPFVYIGAMYLTKYGGETLWQKVRGRVWSGLVVGLASLPLALSAQSWSLLIAQVALAVSSHLALGLMNPLKAEYEEFLISLLTVALVPFMVFHV